ncbi:MAG: SoxR reducing system RseC family protein [Sphaerochaeta sp.]
MYETVTVKRIINDKSIEVSCTSSACSGCKGESFCNTKGKTFEAANKNKLAIKPGMTVEVFLKPSSTIASTLITLIFPLLLFPLSYYLATALGVTEGKGTLLGLGGIIVGFVLVGFYFKRTRANYLPQVHRIIDEEASAEL